MQERGRSFGNLGAYIAIVVGVVLIAAIATSVALWLIQYRETERRWKEYSGALGYDLAQCWQMGEIISRALTRKALSRAEVVTELTNALAEFTTVGVPNAYATARDSAFWFGDDWSTNSARPVVVGWSSLLGTTGMRIVLMLDRGRCVVFLATDQQLALETDSCPADMYFARERRRFLDDCRIPYDN